MTLRPLVRSCLSVAIVTAGLGACRTPAPVSDKSGVNEVDGAAYNCIHDQPLFSDGYSGFAIVSDDQVQRRMIRNGQQVQDNEKTVVPDDGQVRAAMRNIGDNIAWIDQSFPPGSAHRRNEVYRSTGGVPSPYCLFHSPGTRIFGTVMLFHGFNDRPQQQAALGAYLFNSGFNVYNVFLAQEYKWPATEYWPKTVYKPELYDMVKAKLTNPANANAIASIVPGLNAGHLTDGQMATLNNIMSPELSMLTLMKAWDNPAGEEFHRLYQTKDNDDIEQQPSDFLDYVRDAKARLADLAPMPGPIFVAGLSVGGAVAIALAEVDGGERIRGAVAHAPWLEPKDPENTRQLKVMGPLDRNITMLGGNYPLRLQNHNTEYSPASASANLALGMWVRKQDLVERGRNVPTAFISTEVDASASNGAMWDLFGRFNNGYAEGLHYYHQYPADHHVGHALTDPENYASDATSDGGGWNRYWRSLYQEMFRFYVHGEIKHEHFLSLEQDGQLPAVQCKIPGNLAYRCN